MNNIYLIVNPKSGTKNSNYTLNKVIPVFKENNVEYTASSDTIKTVYRNKAITNVRKLVTEGYIKIERTTGDVSIAVEKINL